MERNTALYDLRELMDALYAEYAKWQYVNTWGNGDEVYTDGEDLELARSRIGCYRERIRRMCAENDLPVPGGLPDPAAVAWDYTVRG